MPDRTACRTPRGVFAVIRCDEIIAWSLYWCPSRISYFLGSYSGRCSSGIAGGMMLVGSLVLFSNAAWTIKAALVLACAMLNLHYWLASIIPAKWLWNFDLKMEKEIIHNATYTTALWAAIWTSQSVEWVKQGGHVPKTEAWDRWLEEAGDARHKPREDFDAQARLVRLLK